ILLDLGEFTAGLSGAVRTIPFNTGFGIDLPVSAGLEAHWLLPGTQIILSGYLTGEFAAENNFYLMAGGGIGIIN
ncbi:MAG: S-layer protein, partial [Spirochaetales bacterium]|nr:S-layer protein [Spirochaetales bacterium]